MMRTVSLIAILSCLACGHKPKSDASILFSDSVVQSKDVRGFLLPIGGGAAAGNDNQLKTSHLAIHKAALNKLQSNLAQGAQVGDNVCVLDFNGRDDAGEASLRLIKSLFTTSGLLENRFRNYHFNTLATSEDKASAREVETLCGLIFIPGGDQTVVQNLWDKTGVQEAVRSVLKRGGGLMGKSAGAALQGSLGFFPATTVSADTGTILESFRPSERDFQTDFFTIDMKDLPFFYVETHTGDRERTARALGLMAAWETSRGSRAEKVFGIAVDSDTAALISYDESKSSWTAEIIGARAVEFLFPDKTSQFGVNRAGQGFYTNVNSSVLFERSKVTLSGRSKEKIISTVRSFDKQQTPQKNDCLARLPLSIAGENSNDTGDFSSVYFKAHLPNDNVIKSMDEVPFAYLTGDLVKNTGKGCGFWVMNAFSKDRNVTIENRLNAQRYTLGAQDTDFSISLPATMKAEVVRNEKLQFLRAKNSGSSLFIYDLRNARNRKISSVTYKELGAIAPVQTGSWENGKVHLLVEGSEYNLRSGKVTP